MRLYQLKRLRPFITNGIACRIYKQMILPLLDYADFMIESASPTSVFRLFDLQENAVKYIVIRPIQTCHITDSVNCITYSP